MQKKHITQLMSLILILCLSLTFTGCGKKSDAASLKNTASAKAASPTDQQTTLSGKVKPSHDVDIVSKIPGKVAGINFEVGQQVNEGDVLFTLDDKDIKLQVNQAEAAVNVAKINVIRAKGGSAEQQINQLKASLASAEANYNNEKASYERAKQFADANIAQLTTANISMATAEEGLNNAREDLERTKQLCDANVSAAEIAFNDAQKALDQQKQLFQTGGTSQQALDNAQSNFDVKQQQYSSAQVSRTQSIAAAENKVKSAEDQYNAVKIAQGQTLDAEAAKLKTAEEQYKAAKTALDITQNQINPENAQTAEAQFQQAQAAYDLAKSQLDNTVIKSPISGAITTKNIEVGEMIGNTTVAVKVVDLSTATVNITVPENVVNKVKVGDKVQVNVQAADSKPFEGEISNIDPVADPKAQSYPVQISISNETGLLKGDMFAEVILNTGTN